MSYRGIGLSLLAALALLLPLPAPAPAAPAVSGVRAIRFDPGYYYNTGLPAGVLAERLVAHWARHGVTLVYAYAYSFAYGARYPTRYRYNNQEDFGRLNLLGRVAAEAHRRGIKVVAWVYVLRHRGAWEAHPEWRSLTASGQPYQAGGDRYFLSPHHPDAIRWWIGFLDDLLRALPEIDGVDFAEPIVNWWGAEADYSAAADLALAQAFPRAAPGGEVWRRVRADALTAVLRESARLVKRRGKEVHLTTVMTPRADGTLLTSAEQRAETGFDLEALLADGSRPDVVNVEAIFQQWATAHRAPAVFTPEWTAGAAAAAAAQVQGRAGLIIHVELSDFGGAGPTLPEFARVVRALQAAGRDGIDIYGAHLLDAAGGWEIVRAAFTTSPATGWLNARSSGR